MEGMAFGGTDPTVPINYALNKKLHVDAFIIYSDGEGWAGISHVTQALAEYRKKVNPKAKMINVNMTANGTRLGDENDPLILDIAGFDTETPQLISSFVGL
jgi:60 kDa SS-A/Ro ribonucleoprotein